MLAQGDPIKAMQIYNTVTLPVAHKCAKYLLKLEKEKEYNRQRLYAVINRSLGGDFTPDSKLLEDGDFISASKDKIKKNWQKLAKLMGAKLPKDMEKKLNG